MDRRPTPALAVAALALAVGLMPLGAHAARSEKTKPRTSVPAAAASSPPAEAAAKPAAPANVPLLPGAGSKEPVNIDADKLDYFDKEQKLVYTGDVVAVQGESTLKASVLTIFLQKGDANGQAGGATAPSPAPAAAGTPGAPDSGSSVKHMEADGPVTLISKDQIGTGDHATYDKAENKVYLNGNVTLSQGTNVTQGDRLIYDLTSGQAQVFSGNTNARVKSVFTPGSGAPGESADGAKPAPRKEKPGTARRSTAATGKTSTRRTAAGGAKPAPATQPDDATAEQ